MNTMKRTNQEMTNQVMLSPHFCNFPLSRGVTPVTLGGRINPLSARVPLVEAC